jgi:hypothetical protein
MVEFINMNNMKKILISLFIMICVCSCDQTITRTMGGTTKIELEPGEKLVEATWKGDNIWYLVEPMEADYTPKTKTFKENSRVGVFEGKVIFIEKR